MARTYTDTDLSAVRRADAAMALAAELEAICARLDDKRDASPLSSKERDTYRDASSTVWDALSALQDLARSYSVPTPTPIASARKRRAA